MTLQFEVMEVKAQPTLTMRWQTTMAELPKAFDETFSTLMRYMQEIGSAPASPPFARYYRIDEQGVDVELGVPVVKAAPGRDRIEAGTTHEGSIATGVLVGPYEGLSKAWEALSKWVEEQGLTPTGVPYEVYLSDPSSTPPEQYETRLCFPVER